MVLEVPEGTPFIAISKTVSAMVAAQEYEATTRAFETQRDLTRAALGAEAVPAVAARLARGLSAWVLVLEPSGRVVASAPAGAVEHEAELRDEVGVLRARGLLSSSALDVGSDRVVLHPLGARGTVQGFLAVGRPAGFDRTDQSLVAVAVSLLSLAVERGGGGDTAQQRLRETAMRLLLSGADPAHVPWDLLGWGWLPTEPLRVVRAPDVAPSAALAGPAGERATVAVGRRAGRRGPGHGSRPSRRWPSTLEMLSPAAPVPRRSQTFATAWAQAGGASALARGPGVVWHDAVGRTGLLGVLDPTAARAFADSLLAPLDATGGKADLLESTRAWLAHHGQWDVAAQELGVHRHTLRYRIRRVEELLGRSLDDADLRTELWVALELRTHQDG